MAEGARQVRIFVSSPADARFERSRLERVVERLNGEFQGVARLTPIRWETEFYKAHDTFQAQIPEAAQCDLVMAIFRGRLGTELPPDFPPMADGKPYPSGTAYEVLSAIAASKGRGLPDVYVFRCPQPPLVQLDDPKEAETKAQWERLKTFFENWFMTPDGQFKAAFQTFTSTDDFEAQAEVLLRKWLEEKVLHGRSVTWPVELKGSPFRGLATFGAKHATVFFGRSRDIAKATDRLKDAVEKNCPFMLVVGASGSGKSSLVRAGLAPRLAAAGVVPSIDIWRTAIMRPGETGNDPFAALARALFVGTEDLPDEERGRLPALPELGASDFKQPERLAALLAHADDTALQPVISTLTAIEQAFREKDGYNRDVKAALLLVVDQLDELFDAQIAEDKRAQFATLLGLLARSGRVWIIATLRADLFDRFLGQPVLKQLKENGASYDLAPPDMAELAEIVRGPATAADLAYDTDSATGERLDERLLKDADRPDLLPLLQFTLNQLFEARASSNGQTLLTFAAYRTLGGLEGAVDKEAEAALQTLGEAERTRLPRLLRELAAPAADGGVGASRSTLDIRSVPLAQAAYDDTSRRLVRALVDARILLSAGEGRAATVRLAHTRVLDSWQRAKTIVAENADFFHIRAQVDEQRRRWEAARRSRDFLVGRGRPLAEAETILRQFSEELSPATRNFIEISRRRARLSQRLTAAAALAFAVIAIAASALGLLAYRSEQRTKEALQAAAQERDRARQGLAAANQLAHSLVFDTVDAFRNRGQTQEARHVIDRVIQSYDQVIRLEPSADAYNGRGAAYDDKGDFDHAIADYTQAIALDPTLAYVFNNRGLAYNSKYQYDLAIADFDRAIALDPTYGSAYIDRGNSYRAKGDLDHAIADYDEAIKLRRKDSRAYRQRGLSYMDKGDNTRAIADFDQVIQIEPRSSSAYVSHGQTYRSLGDFDHALADFDRAIQLDPRNATAYDNRGQTYRSKGDLDRALADFNEAITLDPKLTNAYGNRGLLYIMKHDYALAIADFNKALTLNANAAFAYGGRGLASFINGNIDDAMADYGKWVELDPKNAVPHYLRGEIYRNKGSFDQAIAEFNQSIILNQKYADAYLARGQAYSSIDDLDNAIADYSRAIELAPSAIAAYEGRALAYRAKGDIEQAAADYDREGLAYQSRADFDRAIIQFDKALAVDPEFAFSYNDRGLTYISKGDADRAIADFDKAIALNPKFTNAYSNRALAYDMLKGDLDHAIADYGQAIALDPNFALAYGNQGFAYYLKGDMDRALADFGRQIALTPKEASAYYGRGLVEFYRGALTEAQADLQWATEFAPGYAYAVLWRYIVERRTNMPSALTAAVKRLDMTAWPAPLVRLFLGEMTVDEAIAAAPDKDPKTDHARLCEARFYGGELAMLRDQKDEARRLFQLVADRCPRNLFEWRSATGELNTLAVAQ